MKLKTELTDLPLPNPLSPPQGTFLQRLISTWRVFHAARSNYNNQVTPLPNCPKVSVMLITYNHEDYIAQALESILEQERDFSIEINVIDDASTDQTQSIVRKYAYENPGLINCYFNPANAGHTATQLNTIRGFSTLRGQYFSLLEGDDYWTDKQKLKKQIAFLEEEPKFVACAHYTMKVFEDGQPPKHFLPFKTFGRNVAESYDLISMASAFHLSSVVYRNIFKQLPPACFYDPYSCDITINFVYGMFGKFYCIPEHMSAYRIHETGTFSTRSIEEIWNFHLNGYHRFFLYMAPKYIFQFARAVRGFTRYALMAPYRTKEVTSLKPKTIFIFTIHFIVAAAICVPLDIGRAFRRILRRIMIPYLCKGCSRHES